MGQGQAHPSKHFPGEQGIAGRGQLGLESLPLAHREKMGGSLELEDVLLFLVVTSHLADGLVQAEQWLPTVRAPRRWAFGVLVEAQLPLAEHAVQTHPRPGVMRQCSRQSFSTLPGHSSSIAFMC